MTSDSISVPTWNLLVASYLPGIGKSTLWQLASDPGFYKASREGLGVVYPALGEFESKGPKFHLAMQRAQAQVEKAKELGVSIIGFHDTNYPPTLRRAPLAPPLFWFRGNQNALRVPLAAVIGTRHPTNAGRIAAQRIASALAKGGVCVVSGLALGIDAIAHEASVSEGAPTIAVLPGGIDNIAPKTNEPLAERILQAGGGLLSEFPIGLPPLPANFVTRDATQAALSLLVVLIQTDKVGGSLHASRAAIKLKRPLVVAAPIQRDIDNVEPKIDGNLALMSGKASIDSKMAFPPDTMTYLRVLRSREDYPDLLRDIVTSWEAMQTKPRLGTPNSING